MRTMKGPGLFLAQFATDTPPHNTLAGIAKWAKDYGYKAIQIPTWDSRFFDLDRAYDSETYCDEIKGMLAGHLCRCAAYAGIIRTVKDTAAYMRVEAML